MKVVPPGAASDRKNFRLPGDIRPLRYELRLELDLEAWTSKGQARIALRTGRALRELELHSVDLDIESGAIEGGAEIAGVTYDPESQTALLRFDREVPAGEHALALRWAGEIQEKLRGLYRSNRPGERYASTQFEAAEARRAFPCFDEPEFKARWRLELVHASGIAAIANAPIESSQALPDGRTVTRFRETPPISSYLVAFTVGPYGVTPEAKTTTGVPVRVWLPPALAPQGVYARDAHVRAVEWLEAYTAIPYPYTKVDAIGLADFEAGAMENPGAITYRATLLAADEKTASSATFKRVFSVAAHELTHMWWGDLVTMAWWNDLWLNESFASFVGEKATDALNPEWGFVRDVVSQNTPGFNLDSLVSTHPISMEVRNVDEANERFDAVTYLKGQGVLRMMENFLGEDDFRQGVRIYLSRHRERNATANDFWRALDESSGRDVTGVANAWITEPGHPLVHCTATDTGNGLRIDLRQERFFADPDVKPTGQRWPVPLAFRVGRHGGTSEVRLLLESERASIDLPGARWFFPNAGGVGFYRTALDDRSVERLAGALRDLLPEERLALLDNQWALTRARKAPIGQFVDLVTGLRAETDRAVLGQLSDSVRWLWNNVVADADRPAYRGLVEAVYRPRLEALGWDVREGESSDDRETRSLALALLGDLGANDVRREARTRVDAHLAGTAKLPPDLANALVGVAAHGGDAALWERYLARMKEVEATNAQEEARFRGALCDFEDPALARRTAETIFTPTIREQDRTLLLGRLLSSRHGRAAWPVVRDRWDEHVTTMDPGGKQRAVSAVGAIVAPALAPEAIAFLEAKRTPDVKETAAQALERLRVLSGAAKAMSDGLPPALRKVLAPA